MKYEYLISFDPNLGFQEFEEWLNQKGSEGWNLCAITERNRGNAYIFSRLKSIEVTNKPF